MKIVDVVEHLVVADQCCLFGCEVVGEFGDLRVATIHEGVVKAIARYPDHKVVDMLDLDDVVGGYLLLSESKDVDISGLVQSVKQAVVLVHYQAHKIEWVAVEFANFSEFVQ